MKTLVVDCWAIIAWIMKQSPAWSEVQRILDEAEAGQVRLLMSGMNAGEVFYVLAKRHSPELAWRFRRQLPNMPLSVHMPEMEDIWRAAEQKRSYPISYADAFAASLALQANAPLLTGDPEFRSIPGLHLHWLER